MPRSDDKLAVGGYLIIRKYRNGELVWQSHPMHNKVVMSSGHGRNLIIRQLAGDTTYGIEIDSAELGENNTAAADEDTDLIEPIVTGVPITNKTAVDDELTVDVFVADGNLPDDTYEEFGLRIGARMFCRVVIGPAYTKASGEDTLFTYTMSLASS